MEVPTTIMHRLSVQGALRPAVTGLEFGACARARGPALDPALGIEPFGRILRRRDAGELACNPVHAVVGNEFSAAPLAPV